MQRVCALVLIAGLVSFVGCNRSDPGGAAGKNGTFDLSGPATSTTLKQGEVKTIDVKVDRKKDFKEDVKLSVETPPKGITVEPFDAKASVSGPASLKVKAADNAPVGDHELVVTGKPEKGTATTLRVKVKVEESRKADAPKPEEKKPEDKPSGEKK